MNERQISPKSNIETYERSIIAAASIETKKLGGKKDEYR